jgi:hypothetical protein
MIWMTAKVLLGGGSNNDRERVAHGWGLWSPGMSPHWWRVRDDWRRRDWRDMQHALTNLGTEWCRLDAQRAFKVMFWLMVAIALLSWGVVSMLT